MTQHTRREFLGQVACVYAGSAALAAAQTSGGTRWSDRLGLQVYTVRDQLAKDFEGTLAKVAAAGYKEIEMIGVPGDRTPKEMRAILDRVGLAAVSTHVGLAPGPDLDKQLEAYQIIGHRYSAVRPPPQVTADPPRSPGDPGRGAAGGRGPAAPNTADRWKREAEALNQVGQAGKKYGIRALFHNHVNEFVPLEGASGTGYDILLSHTDPSLVAMELDVGWANIAGQDVLGMFKKHPGRYALWHVKDTTGLAAAVAKPIQERQGAAQFVPVGSGDVNYKATFAAAATAGLEHYFVEQDNAVDGDSIAAIRTSAQNLRRLLG